MTSRPDFLTATAVGEVARMVANTMFERSFRVGEVTSDPRDDSRQGAYTGLQVCLTGEPNIAVAFLWEDTDAMKLAAPQQDASAAAKETNQFVSEWLNIVAGQLKLNGGIDHALSLPKQASADDLRAIFSTVSFEGVWLQDDSTGGVVWLGTASHLSSADLQKIGANR